MKDYKEKKLNDFKLNIITQLNDPYSAFSCLLGRRKCPKRTGTWRGHERTNDYSLAASEFDLELKFNWNESISSGEPAGALFPREDGGYNICFHDKSKTSYLLVDISDNKSLETVFMLEEFVEPSPHHPSAIAIGFKSFIVQREGDKFVKLYDPDGPYYVDFDVKNLCFLPDENGEECEIGEWLGHWDRYMEENYSWRDSIFFDYIHNDNNHNLLLSHIKSCGVDQDTAEKIMNSISVGYKEPSFSGEVEYILDSLDRIKKTK